MTSKINPTNIDITYPIAGQDNDTQGFRNNFAATQSNFLVASQEISELQSATANSPQVVSSPFSGTSVGTPGEFAFNTAVTPLTALASYSANNRIKVTSVNNMYLGAPVVFTEGVATVTLTATVTWAANTVTSAQQLISGGNVYQVTGNTFARTFANISANTNPAWTANTAFNYGFVTFSGNTYLIKSNAYGTSFNTVLSGGAVALAFTGYTAVSLLSTTAPTFPLSVLNTGNLTLNTQYYITSIPNTTEITVGGVVNTSNSITLTDSVGAVPATISSAYFYVCTGTNTWVRTPMSTWIGS